MNKTVDIQELAIVVVANNHNPTILNPDFLRYNHIVPVDWELAEPPLCIDNLAKITFANAIHIIARSDKIAFMETIGSKNPDEVKIPGIARKYVQTLHHINYQFVGINIKGHVSFDEEDEASRRYLVETFVAPGPWRDVGIAPVKTGLRFTYTLDGVQLNLSVIEASIEFPEAKSLPVVLFSGNFERHVVGQTKEEKLHNLDAIVEKWQNDIETYREIINKKFLGLEAE